jgi:hypothetical protein
MGKCLFFLFCLMFLFSATCKSQEIGKIYSKADAKAAFGIVKDSVSFSADDFRKILTGTEKFVMMKLVNGKLIILGDGRKVLYPPDAKVDPNDPFSFCSKSKVIELLKLSNSSTLTFEQRNFWNTISYDTDVLEDMVVCPPWCP